MLKLIVYYPYSIAIFSKKRILLLDYSIKISDSGKFLRVVAETDITVEISRNWISELVELSKHIGVINYLFDARTRKNISNITDNYNFSYKDINQLNFDRGCRAAMLVDPEDHSHDFIETTMINAGYNSKIFFDESEAVKWLEA
jgi:hypothetical protein